MKKTLLMFLILILSANLVQGTPVGQGGIAIDHKKNLCFSYWGGGYENSYDGKEVIYPIMYVNIDTDFGNCYLEYSATYLDCCNQLNLTPFNFEKIKDDYKNLSSAIRSDEPRRCGARAHDYSIGWDRGISINTNTKECTSRYIEAYRKNNNEGGITISPSSCISNEWVEYLNYSYEYHVITSYGTCSNFSYDGSARDCCDKLGLNYGGSINAYSGSIIYADSENIDEYNEQPENKNIFVTAWESLVRFIRNIFR